MNTIAHCTKVTIFVTLITALSACSTISEYLSPFSESGVPDIELPSPEARPRLEPIDKYSFVLESPDQTVIGKLQIVFTKEEDTFSDLAREYGLGYDELVDANPEVDPWLPGDGTRVILPTQHVLPDVPKKGIVLNIASKRLFYFQPTALGQPQTIMTFPIGIGRVGWKTPLGLSKVIDKARDPYWYVPPSVRKEHKALGDPLPTVVPPGPENPLGRHVLKLDIPGYLIHGTNQPYGVGMRVSHGCVRLYPEDIELLYGLVGVGEPVSIINEPFLLGWKDDNIFFESHLPLEDDEISAEQRLINVLEKVDQLVSKKEKSLDIDQIRLAASTMTGVPLILTNGSPDEQLVRARVIVNTVNSDSIH